MTSPPRRARDAPAAPAPEDGGGLSLASIAAPAVWITAAKIAAFAVNVALPLILVRKLGQQEFGLYKQSFLIVGTMTASLPVNFAMSALYFLAREPERRSEFVVNVMIVQTFVAAGAALTVFFFPALIAWMSGANALVDLVGVLSLVIFLWVFSAFLEIVMMADRDYRGARVFILVTPFVRSLLLIGAALRWGSLAALLWAAVIYGALQAGCTIAYLWARFPKFWRSYRWPTMRTQIAYSIPLSLSGFLWVVLTDLHSYWVSSRFGPAAFAIYSVGCFELPLIGILSESLTNVAIPRWSELRSRGLDREVVRTTIRVLRSLALVHFAIYAFFIVCGREFLLALFTEAYAASWPIFAINLTLLPLNALMLDPIVRAYPEHQYFLLRIRALFIVALIVLLWAGTSRFGMVGAIAATVAVILGERIVLAARIFAALGIAGEEMVQLRQLAKIAGAAALAAIATVAAKGQFGEVAPMVSVLLSAPVFVVVYTLAVVGLRAVGSEDLERLSGALSRLRG